MHYLIKDWFSLLLFVKPGSVTRFALSPMVFGIKYMLTWIKQVYYGRIIYIGVLQYNFGFWHFVILSFWHFVILSFWHFGILALWHCGIFALWHCGIFPLWHFGILAFWHFGILAFWHFGILAFNRPLLKCHSENILFNRGYPGP